MSAGTCLPLFLAPLRLNGPALLALSRGDRFHCVSLYMQLAK